MILPIYQMYVLGARNFYGKVCIEDTSIRKCMKKHITPMSNKNNITYGWKTFMSVMLLQSDINKWRLSKLDKLDKLYIYSASTRLLQRSKHDFIEYKNGIFPNNSHINLRACDAA